MTATPIRFSAQVSAASWTARIVDDDGVPDPEAVTVRPGHGHVVIISVLVGGDGQLDIAGDVVDLRRLLHAVDGILARHEIDARMAEAGLAVEGQEDEDR